MERFRVLTKQQVKQLPCAREGLALLEAQLDGEEINASSGEESAALATIGLPDVVSRARAVPVSALLCGLDHPTGLHLPRPRACRPP